MSNLSVTPPNWFLVSLMTQQDLPLLKIMRSTLMMLRILSEAQVVLVLARQVPPSVTSSTRETGAVFSARSSSLSPLSSSDFG